MTTTRASKHGIGQYAAIVGALHSIDRAKEVQRRRERAEVCALFFTIGILVAAIAL